MYFKIISRATENFYDFIKPADDTDKHLKLIFTQLKINFTTYIRYANLKLLKCNLLIILSIHL